MAWNNQHIGGYRIIAPIGVGASATVYRALDEITGDEVAIKVLADNHSLLPDMRQRFLDEVELLSAIDSRSVAKIYELGETESGQPFMVLELADRGDLRHRVEDLRHEGRALGRADLALLGAHLVGSLSALHETDIVHRDVSPGNVLIRGGDEATQPDQVSVLEHGERLLLADLGFAKDLEYASGLTAGGGTRGFAAPEQRDEVTVIDRRADIFSASALIEWAAKGTGLLDELDPFLDVGLATDPSDRFDTIEQWGEALDNALGLEPVSATSRAAEEGSGHRLRGKSWPLRVGGALLAAAIVAVAAGPGGLINRSDGAGEETDGEIAIDDDQPEPADVATTSVVTSPDAADDTGIGQAQTLPQAAANGDRPADADGTDDPAAPGADDPAVTTTTVPAVTEGSSSTTIDSRFEGSPRAYIESPEPEGRIGGDLTVGGRADYAQGVATVELVIKNLDTGLHWHDQTKTFESSWVRFTVAVDPVGAEAVAWQYTVPDEALEPGRYMLRAWARATTGNGDPISNIVYLTVV